MTIPSTTETYDATVEGLVFSGIAKTQHIAVNKTTQRILEYYLIEYPTTGKSGDYTYTWNANELDKYGSYYSSGWHYAGPAAKSVKVDI